MLSSTDSAVPVVQEFLAERLEAAVRGVLPEDAEMPRLTIDRSKAGFSSDYQCAAAMQLARVLKRSPRDIGAMLAEALEAAADPRLEAIEVSGPGFVGLRLSESYLRELLGATLASPRTPLGEGEQSTVVIDYSSPNVAKRMHIGHIRSTVIGDALRRMGSFLGHKVIADNHIGDWGTQFGQLIYAWRNWRDDAGFAADPVGELERLYVRFHKEAETDESLADAAREELRKLQAGDPENNELWQLFRRSSQDAFDSIYERLGVRFDVTYGESHYNDRLAPLVDRLLEQGIAEYSEGAVCVFFRDDGGDGFSLPAGLVHGDGMLGR